MHGGRAPGPAAAHWHTTRLRPGPSGKDEFIATEKREYTPTCHESIVIPVIIPLFSVNPGHTLRSVFID